MKLNDIINEEPISEVPVGFGKALKTGLRAMNPLSTSGRAQASGEIDSNNRANKIYSDYYRWVGQHNMPTSVGSVLDFLKQNRYPTASIKAATSTMSGGAAAPLARNAVIDKAVIGKAFLSAAQKFGVTTPGSRTRPGAPAPTTPSPAPAPSPTPSAPPAPSPAPSAGGTITKADIYSYYKSLSPEDRETLKQNLDLIDAEPPAAPPPMDINEGYSQFLGMKL